MLFTSHFIDDVAEIADVAVAVVIILFVVEFRDGKNERIFNSCWCVGGFTGSV